MRAPQANMRELRDRISRAVKDVRQNRDRVTRTAVESMRKRAQRCITLGGSQVDSRWRAKVVIKLSVLVNMNGLKLMLRLFEIGSVEGI